MFDTICHEHLEYYSKIIICVKNDLKVIDVFENDINGSSKQFYISKINSKFKVNQKKINKILREEIKLKIHSKKKISNFFKEIKKIKTNLLKLLNKIKKQNKRIHAYGASTKGNVLLQYFGIDNRFIDYVSERNPLKYNLYTPGTSIKIISESDSRSLRPDYYLVLPWHFKKKFKKKKIRLKQNLSFHYKIELY